MKPALIILDRDGVINQDSDNYIRSADEWIPIPGSIEAIAALSKAGYSIAIATNQSGLARGYFDNQILEAMHHKLVTLVNAAGGQIAHIAYCPHGPADDCDCRKPKPGLMHQISNALSIPLTTDVVVIGDSIRDLEAGIKAGCTVVLVKTGKGQKSLVKLKDPEYSPLKNIAVYNNLADFVNNLLAAA